MPQYNNAKEELVDAIIPSNQIVALVATRAQHKMQANLAGNLALGRKTALLQDKWFVKTKKMCACALDSPVGSKLCVSQPKTLSFAEET